MTTYLFWGSSGKKTAVLWRTITKPKSKYIYTLYSREDVKDKEEGEIIILKNRILQYISKGLQEKMGDKKCQGKNLITVEEEVKNEKLPRCEYEEFKQKSSMKGD